MLFNTFTTWLRAFAHIPYKMKVPCGVEFDWASCPTKCSQIIISCFTGIWGYPLFDRANTASSERMLVSRSSWLQVTVTLYLHKDSASFIQYLSPSVERSSLKVFTVSFLHMQLVKHHLDFVSYKTILYYIQVETIHCFHQGGHCLCCIQWVGLVGPIQRVGSHPCTGRGDVQGSEYASSFIPWWIKLLGGKLSEVRSNVAWFLGWGVLWRLIKTKQMNRKGNNSLMESCSGQSNFPPLCVRLTNLVENWWRHVLSNTMPLNHQNSELMHENDHDHEKRLTTTTTIIRNIFVFFT
jgi:hypothetical protein